MFLYPWMNPILLYLWGQQLQLFCEKLQKYHHINQCDTLYHLKKFVFMERSLFELFQKF